MKFIDHEGKMFGCLCVLTRGPNMRQGNTQWWCRCICGSVILVSAGSLVSGNTKSCGCLKKKLMQARNTKHGKYETPAYNIWRGMKRRCVNSNCKDYVYYGGRGIFVCRRWRNAFENFSKDMGERPAGKSIDRIDNNGPYGKWNCKWSTPKEQANNRRWEWEIQ